MAIVA